MSPLILDYHGVSRRSMTRNRRYMVTSAKLKDVRRLVDIEFHAFENERVNQVLSYRDYKKPAHFERSVKVYQEALFKQNNAIKLDYIEDRWGIGTRSDSHSTSSQVGFKKITNTETNQIISFTKYEIKTYSREELGSPFDSGHEGEPKMNRDWYGLNERLRRQYIGRAEHCCKYSLYRALHASEYLAYVAIQILACWRRSRNINTTALEQCYSKRYWRKQTTPGSKCT